ncbi:MAG TPA: hypothetical protein VFU38_05435, partial [Candidatus Krumholzibacteria bacterium]|nr:hypothetical protein [Candidatus Krumholzibacteria bacterium]
ASLVASLRAVGAVPVIHCDGVPAAPGLSDTVRFGGPLSLAAPAAIASTRPDVVVHTVTVESSGAENEDERAWHHVVRESEFLVCELWRQRPGCRLVVAGMWGSARPGDPAAAVGAAMEAVILNRAGAEPASVVRLPRILTASLLDDAPWSAGTRTRMRFDALETEAVSVLLEIAAGGFRGIYTLAPAAEIDLDDALRSLASSEEDQAPPLATAARSSLVFPAEHLDLCGVDGARRVLSPLFPAADALRELADMGPAGASAAERDEWTRAVTAQLYRGGAVGEPSPRSRA